MSEQPAPQENEAVGGKRLTLGRLVHRGASEMWRLAGPPGGKPTAIVQVVATDWRRTADEATELATSFRTVTSLDLPSCLLPVDFGLLQGTGVYITFPRPTGRLLPRLIDQNGAMPIRDVLETLSRLAACLDRGHAVGCLHLGLAPVQIVVGAPPSCSLLIDFGLRSQAIAQRPDRDLNLDRDRWAYWAPEVWRRGRLTPATDQFALGALAFLMLTGRSLLEAASVDAAEQESLAGPARRLAELDDGLAQSIAQALAANSSERFKDCRAFVAALAARAPSQAVQRPLPSAHAANQRSDQVELDDDYDVVVEFSDAATGGATTASTIEAPQRNAVGANAPPVVAAPGRAVQGTPGPRRRTIRLRDVCAAAVLLALPLCAYLAAQWRRPTLVVSAPQRERSTTASLSRGDIQRNVAEVEQLLADLASVGGAELAPDEWNAARRQVDKVNELAGRPDIDRFLEATVAARETLGASISLCRRYQEFDADYAKTVTSETAQLVKKYDAQGWQSTEELLDAAQNYRRARNWDKGQAKLQEAAAIIRGRRVDALRGAAIIGADAETQLAAASEFLANDHVDENVERRFNDLVRDRPEFWREQAVACATDATGADAAILWADSALALHRSGNAGWTEAFQIARREASDVSDGADRCRAWESLLESAIDLGNAAAAIAVLDDLSDNGADGPADAMHRLLGYSLLFQHERSFVGLLARPRQDASGPLQTLAVVSRHTGDFTAPRRFIDGSSDVSAVGGLALAAAMRGEREAFREIVQQMQSLPRDRATADLERAYTAAGNALLGNAALALASLPSDPAAADIVRACAALGAANAGRLDAALAALEPISTRPAQLTEALHSIGRAWAMQDESTAADLYRWAAKLPSSFHRGTLFWTVFGAVTSEGATDSSATGFAVASVPAASMKWSGELRTTRSGRAAAADQDVADIELYVIHPPAQAAPGAALVACPAERLFMRAAVEQTPQFLMFRSLPESGEIAGENASGFVYLVRKSEIPAFGLEIKSSASKRGGELAGALLMRRSEPISNDAIAELQIQRLDAYFRWMLAGWPPREPTLWSNQGRTSIVVQVIGTRAERELVARQTAKLKRALPDGWDLRCDPKPYSIHDAQASPASGGIYVHFFPQSEHAKSAERLYDINDWRPGRLHDARPRSQGRRSRDVAYATVMIDNETLSGVEQERAVLIELVRAMGLAPQGACPLDQGSLFAPPGGQIAVELTELDAAVMRYIYQFCNAEESLDDAADKFATLRTKFTSMLPPLDVGEKTFETPEP